MINTNSLNTPKTTGADLTQLVEQLAKRADLNRDGQVSTSEFAQFLVGLLQQSTSGDSTGDVRRPRHPRRRPRGGRRRCCRRARPGWDAAKWVNPDHNTPKYVVGRILSQIPADAGRPHDALPASPEGDARDDAGGRRQARHSGVGIVDVGIPSASAAAVGWWLGSV